MLKEIKFAGVMALVINIYAGVHSARAQSPGWSVNASDYQYSMNVTGAYFSNCAFAGQLEDTVAAFVDGQLRGVAPVSDEVNDRSIAFLTIFSNSPFDEEVTFSYYSKASDRVSELRVTTDFLEGRILGGRSNPFQLYEEEPLSTVSVALENNTISITEMNPAFNQYTWYRNDEPLVGEGESSLMPKSSGDYRVEVLTKGGCNVLSNSITVTIEQTLGFEEEMLNATKLFPVPFSNSFFVQLPAKQKGFVKLIIHDLSGKVMTNIELDRNQTDHEVHQMTSAPTGVYLAQLELDGVVKTYRIKKE